MRRAPYITRPRVARAERQAAAWMRRLSRLSISTEELRAFAAWKRIPRNGAAYAALERERRR